MSCAQLPICMNTIRALPLLCVSQARRSPPCFSDEEEAPRGHMARPGSRRGNGEGWHPKPTLLTAELACPLELSDKHSCQNQTSNSSVGERGGQLGQCAFLSWLEASGGLRWEGGPDSRSFGSLLADSRPFLGPNSLSLPRSPPPLCRGEGGQGGQLLSGLCYCLPGAQRSLLSLGWPFCFPDLIWKE